MSSRFTKAGSFIVLLFSAVFFFIGFHSVDIAHAVAIHHNDWNKAKIDKGYLDLRNYEDCNLLGCHRYQTFYMFGMTLLLVSFFILYSVLLFIALTGGKK